MPGNVWRAIFVSSAILLISTTFVSATTSPIAISAANGDLQPQVEERITQLISQMTLEEKVGMLGGVNYMDTRPIPRLGIPAIRMNDGPVGVRADRPTTAFPAGIAMGASFNPSLVQEVAKAIADETRFMGRNMLLGPCVNLSRTPFGGRNFESFGEDPYLTSQLAASYVRGVQGQNVLASVKHFALNEQEYERMSIDVHADTRTMFELHFPAFKAAIDAGSWTVMASYNKVNGHHATENDYLMNQILKRHWGFKGFVVSDWEATHSAVEAANNGLDLEMPSGLNFGAALLEGVRQGRVQESVIDDKVRRLLRAMFVVGIMGSENAPVVAPPVGPETPEHRQLARQMAQESAVLLKNADGILPLKASSLRRVAVIGPNAAQARTGGGGSSHVDLSTPVNPMTALIQRLGEKVEVRYALGVRLPPDLEIVPSSALRPTMDKTGGAGLKGEYFDNPRLEGTPVLTRTDAQLEFNSDQMRLAGLKENFSVRWTGFFSVPVSGHYKLSTLSDDGVRLFLDGKELISNWTNHGETVDTAEVELQAHHWYPIRIEYYQGILGMKMQFGWTPPQTHSLMAAAVEAARNSDVAVVFAGMGYDESEGFDRGTMNLPNGQDELIRAVAAVNPKTIVVLNGGNPVSMGSWLPAVPGLLHAWYPGQEGAEAIVDLLMGDINPSGKLPVTFIKRWEDSAAYGNYPGVNGRVDYKEGIFLGYRHAEAKQIRPEFPFGFGLSYTQFEFSDMNVRLVDAAAAHPKVEVRFQLKNIGPVAGAEVAQLYVGEKSPILPRPVKELKAFRKVHLQPGEFRTVVMELDAAAFAFFEAESMTWKVQPGFFQLTLGSSSQDAKMSYTLRLL